MEVSFNVLFKVAIIKQNTVNMDQQTVHNA